MLLFWKVHRLQIAKEVYSTKKIKSIWAKKKIFSQYTLSLDGYIYVFNSHLCV